MAPADRPSTCVEQCRDWVGHVIVCGLNDVALRTVEQLHLAGARVVVLDDEPGERLVRIVRGWGIPHLPRGGHLSRAAVRRGHRRRLGGRVRREHRPAHARDGAADPRSAPRRARRRRPRQPVGRARASRACCARSACSTSPRCSRRRSSKRASGAARARSCSATRRSSPPRWSRRATARCASCTGSLAPIGVVTEADDELIACPGRDQPVSARDRVTLLGTRAELDAAGLVRRERAARAAAAAAARARAASLEAHRAAPISEHRRPTAADRARARRSRCS